MAVHLDVIAEFVDAADLVTSEPVGLSAVASATKPRQTAHQPAVTR
jgi:hypothetical protein